MVLPADGWRGRSVRKGMRVLEAPDNRRPIASRSSGWAEAAAAWLAGRGVSGNAISFTGLVAALVAGAAFALGPAFASGFVFFALMLAGAALCQVRLLCNLLDGLVAVEHGRATATGPIWNELPDRVSDVAILVGAGYGIAAAGYPEALGWAAGVVAVLVAYVREFGRALGLPADFSGPLAKQQRMFVVTLGALASLVEPAWGGAGDAMALALVVVIVGGLLTAGLRTRRIAVRLAARSGDGNG